jgi:hypothetical protein
VAAAIAAAIFLPGVLDQENAGFPGVEPGEPGAGALQIEDVEDFDPDGDDSEHPDDADNAADQNTSTAWETEEYSTPLQDQKPGVGLVFDLGDSVEVGSVEVQGSSGMDFEVAASDDSGDSAEDFEAIGSVEGAGSEESVDAGGTAARYWLVWITNLPGGGPGVAAISEVEFVGP